jgi:DNA-binding MarR family transcriptional regulator
MKAPSLEQTVDSVLDSLPPVWDRIRGKLRAGATGRFAITLEQFHTLRHIRRGCDSVKGLAERLQVSRPAVSQAVDALAAKGLVTRVQESEDRRCMRIHLTPYASEVMDENFEENRAWMKSQMASLTGKELAAIDAAMRTLRRTFAPEDRKL